MLIKLAFGMAMMTHRHRETQGLSGPDYFVLTAAHTSRAFTVAFKVVEFNIDGDDQPCSCQVLKCSATVPPCAAVTVIIRIIAP